MAWLFIAGYVGLLVAFYLLSAFLEKSAALRGAHRKRLPSWVDKSIRIFFLITLMYPLIVVLPYLTLPLVLIYTPSYVDGSESTGSRASGGLRRSPIFKVVKWYFKLRLMVQGDTKLDPSLQYIVGIHPHGFLPVATMVNSLSEVNTPDALFFNGVRIRALAASFCFYIPGYRDFLLAGGVIDAARYNARAALDKHNVSLMLVPGGASEALHALPGKNILVLKKRLGFVKLALETGAHLVPAYSFGENDCYNQLASVFPQFRAIQAKFQRIFGLSLPIVTSIIPRRVQVTTVYGRPIPVVKVEKPTDEEVQALLDIYIVALTGLFEEFAPQCIDEPKNRVLEIL